MSRSTGYDGDGKAERAVLSILAFYQGQISPLFGRRCRFLPTCSEYAKTAIERFGVLKGFPMVGRRLLRCQPFGSEGYDPVPQAGQGVRSC